MSHKYEDFEKTFLQENNEFLERIARYYVLDSIRCEMHNMGYEIEGNTEANDVTWFARVIFDADRYSSNHHWDTAPDEVRERYLELAKIAMKAIPRLMSRISARCIRIAEAVNTIVKAEKLHEYYEEQEKHPTRKAGL